jgi:dTMP kinase
MSASGRGRFITLEGGEGAGKSTQAKLLAQRLEGMGISVIVTREPGGSPGAEWLRDFILSGEAAPFGPAGEAILFSAARIDHVDHTIAPALARGAWVISDRFADSTRAYQGAAGKLDPALIASLERVAIGDVRPDLTLVLEADRFEREGEAFHEALRQAFLDIARAEPRRCAVIDADRPAQEVEQAIWASVCERLGQALGAESISR